MLDALLEGFQVIDPDFRYVHVNLAAARHGKSSREALVGCTMMECYPGIEHTELFTRLRRCMSDRKADLLENEFRYPDGSLGQFELRIEPVPQGICVLSIDVTARKQAESRLRETEERMRQAERLEAVGRLAAGIAHDFNTLITVMLGYGEAALQNPRGPDPEDIEAMMSAARRSADLTRQLLAFGRRQVMRSETVDPVSLVKELEVLLRRTLPSNVALVLRASQPVGTIEFDRTKLEQVVMNLVLNARDAMPSGGRIIIDLRSVELDEEYVRHHPGAQVGPHVLLVVSDDGIGMDADTQARIFEPFFSTKEQGKGTGLGLATVYGVVKQCGGDIWVYSELGHGTTFKVYLPRSPAVQPIRPTKPPAAAVTGPSQSGATVLLAEDDAMLCKLAERTLLSAGYRVLTAGSGTHALELCESDPLIAILITDVMMPGMRGPELVAKALRLRPDLKVLCTSGYGSTDIEGLRDLSPDLPFLEKPYLPSALLRAVEHALLSPAQSH